ncbi:P-selectin-like isoform X1 [Porites lutea]|uniref:P-selectin-like isoform X1 n=1 Tax=Porites lutea TaxID=51062 RepID=UPI003CC5B2E4
MNQVMYFKVLLCLVLAITLKRINGQSSTCGQPTPPYGSTIIHPLQQNQHNSGSVVLFGCKEGFYLVGMPIIRCTGNTWTTIKFRCLGFCPDIGHILNGQVVHVTPKVGQAAVQFHCNKTHRLIGKPRLECINGRWNGVLPFCEKLKSCAPLSTPGNGTLHGSDTSHGAKASFACLTGFDLFGSRTLTCSNGVWNTITPTCKAQCQKITHPLNGRKYGTRFSHGAIASFECNVGYKLVGSRSLLCVDGKWNASVPVCNAMLCPRPSIPPNSYVIYPGIKGSYVHGIKLFLGCRDGYYLTGSPIMDCNHTVWSKVEFRCIAKCPALRQLKNGIITHVTLRNGGEVKIKCLTNYTLDGSSKRFCRKGKWSDGLPTCRGLWF